MGATLDSLPCGGCNFCTRLHHQWARFEDDVVPLAIRRISLEDKDPDWGDILSPDFTPAEESTFWLPSYPPEELHKALLEDPDLAKLIEWLVRDITSPGGLVPLQPNGKEILVKQITVRISGRGPKVQMGG